MSEGPALLGALESFVQPSSRVDPQSKLGLTLESIHNVAGDLDELGHTLSYRTVGTCSRRLAVLCKTMLRGSKMLSMSIAMTQDKPKRTRTHNLKNELGRVSRYGVFDVIGNEAWMSVGISADTTEYAELSLCNWLQQFNQKRYGNTDEIYITADSITATVTEAGCGRLNY